MFTTASAVRVSRGTPFAPSCLTVPAGATIYTNAEVEPHLAIDRADPNHLVAAWQQDRLSDGGALGLATSVSVDGGTTWSAPQPAPFSTCAGGEFSRASDPWVAVAGSTVIQIGIAFTGAANTIGSRSAVVVSRSLDGGISWGPAVLLVDDDGTRLFNDKEALTIDAFDPRYVYAVWDRIGLDERGPTLFARSTDGGATWEQARTIYDPGPGRQTIGNVPVTTPDGAVHVFFVELGPVAGNPSATEGHVSVVRSSDKGLNWSAPTRIAELLSVGTRTPEQGLVVRTGEILAAFAAGSDDGALYAAWQDARFTDGGHDAIALARSTDGGATWTAPSRVNARPDVPAFTPTLAVLPGGAVGVTYYDFRQPGTGTYRPTDLWLATSRDAVNWAETRLAGDFDLLDAPNAGGLFVGDYHGLVWSDASTFVALYARTNNGETSNRTDVYADRVPLGAPQAARATTDVAASKPSATKAAAALRPRVSEHLSAVRQWRLDEWRRWRESSPDSMQRGP
ncbi:MAG TPA: sialidase family protein [Steroidobacteraceae bacterium]|nr:sialidase family protein [Steroidobacteraceae bacterium]